MSGNPILRIRAKGGAFSIGWLSGRASASRLRERVLVTESITRAARSRLSEIASGF